MNAISEWPNDVLGGPGVRHRNDKLVTLLDELPREKRCRTSGASAPGRHNGSGEEDDGCNRPTLDRGAICPLSQRRPMSPEGSGPDGPVARRQASITSGMTSVRKRRALTIDVGPTAVVVSKTPNRPGSGPRRTTNRTGSATRQTSPPRRPSGAMTKASPASLGLLIESVMRPSRQPSTSTSSRIGNPW